MLLFEHVFTFVCIECAFPAALALSHFLSALLSSVHLINHLLLLKPLYFVVNEFPSLLVCLLELRFIDFLDELSWTDASTQKVCLKAFHVNPFFEIMLNLVHRLLAPGIVSIVRGLPLMLARRSI